MGTESAIHRRVRRWVIVTAAAGAILLLGGCGPSNENGGEEVSDPPGKVDLSVVRQALYDFEPVASAEALATAGRNGRLHDAIVAGRIESVTQGRSIFEGSDVPAPQVLVEVQVTDELRTSSPDYIRDSSVYFELYQGPVHADGGPEVIDTPIYTLEDWNQALPAGTPVLLFLNESEEEAVGTAPDLPSGARVMAPDTQGLILEGGGELLGGLVDIDPGWTDTTSVAQLVERLRSLLG